MDPEQYFPFPLMLSPVFSFDAAFEALRLEVVGDDGGDTAAVVGGIRETGGFGGAGGVEREGRSGRPEAEEDSHRKAGGVRRAAVGRGGKGLSRPVEEESAESSGVAGADGAGDTARRGNSGASERRRRRSQVWRRSGAPSSAVVEVKGVHAGAKTVAPSDDVDCSIKVGLLLSAAVDGCLFSRFVPRDAEVQRTSKSP